MTIPREHPANPPKKEAPEMTARQRGNKSRSGVNAARVMRSAGPNAEQAPAPQPRRRPQDGNFANPSEFLAGPRKPGKITQGVRRFSSAEKDSVGFMLTDEYLMTGGSYGGPKVSRKPHIKSSVNNHCGVLTEEAPFRPGHRILRPGTGLDAPYFEDNDPRAPRACDIPPTTGKRIIHKRNQNEIFLAPGQQDPTYKPPVTNVKTNRSNRSLNVTNLSVYTAEQLHEPQVYERQRGPRQFIAPDIYPRRKPIIAPINTPAKAEHDVLGNGRYGRPEKERSHGLGRGSCRPPRSTANLFARPARDPAEEGNEHPEEKAETPSKKSMLRYYDPAVDAAEDFSPEAPHASASKSNMQSRYVPAPNTGKGRGEFYPKGTKTTPW